ncbi:MAG: hypothetical protein IID45_03405 [Planctomycetes bacterium]|nr:hypothetical protein [Planctomycetota bacterium]
MVSRIDRNRPGAEEDEERDQPYDHDHAHNGGDPGGRDAVVMVWYEVKKRKGAPPKFIRHEIKEGRDTGIGTQFQVIDINGDNRPDIVLSNKKGVNLLIQVP